MKKKNYTILITALISEEMNKEIRRISDKEEISVSEFIRDAIEEKQKNYFKEDKDHDF
jgi:hypothetical protein